MNNAIDVLSLPKELPMTIKESTTTTETAACCNIRTGTSAEELAQAILDNLYFVQGRIPVNASSTSNRSSRSRKV